MTNELRDREQAQAKILRPLIAAQVVIAAVALVVLIVLGVKIRPLIETKNSLEVEIKRDKTEISVLEQALASRKREIESAERTLQDVAEKIPQNSASQHMLQEEIGSQGKIAIRPTQMKDAYVIVLGSYKRFGGAIQSANDFKTLTGENVRLLYSIGDYYAPVIGPIKSRQKAEEELAKIRSRVPDAFVFTSGAFIYEIDFANSTPKGTKSEETQAPPNPGPQADG